MHVNSIFADFEGGNDNTLTLQIRHFKNRINTGVFTKLCPHFFDYQGGTQL